MSAIRIGIIGAGGITAKLHLPELLKLPDFKVTLLAGRKDSRLKILSEKFGGAKTTHSYDDVIADSNVDAVIIATPHPQHVSWGIKALSAGKHILMQKPLCGEMAEADTFVAAVEKSKRTVLCMPHFQNTVYTVRQLIRDGAIGKISGARARTSHGGPEIYYAEIHDFFGETDKDLWFFDSKRAGVGALFDMGVYAVANLVAALGNVVKVTGITATLDKLTDMEDVATLLLQLEKGGIATAETSWCDPARTWEMSIHGTAGKFIMPGRDGAALTKWTPTSYTREDSPPKHEPVACGAPQNVHEHFLECIKKGIQPPLSNVRTARHVTEILLAGLESSRTGRAVAIKSRAE